jgi:hypothetical protein
MTKSPVPLDMKEPVRARPITARDAMRSRFRGDNGASVARTIMHEPPLSSTASR